MTGFEASEEDGFDTHQPQGEPIHLAHRLIPASGLMPDTKGRDGTIRRQKLVDALQHVTDPQDLLWLSNLARSAWRRQKTARFEVKFGEIAVIVAIGFELGIRHGKDIRRLSRPLKMLQDRLRQASKPR